jgi:hypothetical protein
MGRGVDHARRSALVLLVWATLAPQAVGAQDLRAAAAQRVAREWLAIVDKYDAQASWNAAGERFQRATPPALWVETIKRDREPRGALVQRTVESTEFGNTAADLPEGGSYGLVRFRSAFANAAISVEDVTLEVGPDYAWHVIGYVIE